MELAVNGHVHFFPESILDLSTLMERLGVEQPHFAGIILNGIPVDVAQRRELSLRDGDRVEILPYLGGG